MAFGLSISSTLSSAISRVRNLPHRYPILNSHLRPSFQSNKEMVPQSAQQSRLISRRAAAGAIAVAVAIFFSGYQETAEAATQFISEEEKAESNKATLVRSHAQSLLEVKALLESESWVKAQKMLRRSSAMLKQDIYAIIQSKPTKDRSMMRELYSNLFNNVTKLAYAARDKDVSRVWRCYDKVVVALNDILSVI